ncbi:MAG: hypothetical protein U0R18_12195 [Mycobacterium sp.]
MTEPHHAPIFDTGPHPEPLNFGGDAVDYTPPVEVNPYARASREPVHIDLSGAISSEPVVVPAAPVAVPGQFAFIKRWKLALVLAGVWLVGALAGAGMYFWWFHAMDKTWVEFAALVFVIVCVVAALLVAMVDNRPTLSAVALAVMSTPCAAACGAGLLYGLYAYRLITATQ